MKNFMKTYNDPFRKFVFDTMQKVEYFEQLSDDDKHNIAFNFE